jgi:hypothetical protein
MGQDAFAAAARDGLGAWGVGRICQRIAVAAYAALADGTGVTAQWPGALEHAFWVLGDWQTVRRDPGRDRRPVPVHHRPRDVQARRPGTLRELQRQPTPARPTSPATRASPRSSSNRATSSSPAPTPIT